MNIQTGIEIFHGDCEEVIQRNHIQADVIITDPPYDIQLPKTLSIWCSGIIVVFCKPENQFNTIFPTEYLFWVKTPSTKNYSKSCGRFVEMILVHRRAAFNPLHWSQMTGVYDDRLITLPVHPYEKPLALIERLVRIYSNPGDVILDPYMGSGTTGLACSNLGRRFIGVEKEQEYFDIAKSKLELL